MTVAAVVTEAIHGTALLAECRRCIEFGVPLGHHYVRQVIDLIENAAITDMTSWTQAVSNFKDGRNAEQAAAIA